ncbi:hypothetical protein [Gorillibacterium timonense]|uniref:hypothetical protein n=1 Tax=Gorillibacterium timonense TaxID=1689269 RepID=UPI00071D352D|nr:hypothetical protein [Gorillibacterium timonense]
MIKKLKLLIICSLLALSFVQPVSAEGETVTVKVKLTNVELVESKGMASNWKTEIYVNEKSIKEGNTVKLTLKSTDSVKLKAVAKEQDKQPSSGSKTSSVKLSSFKEKTNETLNFRVSKGTNSDKYAKWKVKFTIVKSSS